MSNNFNNQNNQKPGTTANTRPDANKQPGFQQPGAKGNPSTNTNKGGMGSGSQFDKPLDKNKTR